MAQKVNPLAVRLGVNRGADSSWFSDYYYATLLSQDLHFREYLLTAFTNGAAGTPLLGRCVIHHYPKISFVHFFCLFNTKRWKRFVVTKRQKPLYSYESILPSYRKAPWANALSRVYAPASPVATPPEFGPKLVSLASQARYRPGSLRSSPRQHNPSVPRSEAKCLTPVKHILAEVLLAEPGREGDFVTPPAFSRLWLDLAMPPRRRKQTARKPLRRFRRWSKGRSGNDRPNPPTVSAARPFPAKTQYRQATVSALALATLAKLVEARLHKVSRSRVARHFNQQLRSTTPKCAVVRSKVFAGSSKARLFGRHKDTPKLQEVRSLAGLLLKRARAEARAPWLAYPKQAPAKQWPKARRGSNTRDIPLPPLPKEPKAFASLRLSVLFGHRPGVLTSQLQKAAKPNHHRNKQGRARELIVASSPERSLSQTKETLENTPPSRRQSLGTSWLSLWWPESRLALRRIRVERRSETLRGALAALEPGRTTRTEMAEPPESVTSFASSIALRTAEHLSTTGKRSPDARHSVSKLASLATLRHSEQTTPPLRPLRFRSARYRSPCETSASVCQTAFGLDHTNLVAAKQTRYRSALKNNTAGPLSFATLTTVSGLRTNGNGGLLLEEAPSDIASRSSAASTNDWSDLCKTPVWKTGTSARYAQPLAASTNAPQPNQVFLLGPPAAFFGAQSASRHHRHFTTPRLIGPTLRASGSCHGANVARVRSSHFVRPSHYRSNAKRCLGLFTQAFTSRMSSNAKAQTSLHEADVAARSRQRSLLRSLFCSQSVATLSEQRSTIVSEHSAPHFCSTVEQSETVESNTFIPKRGTQRLKLKPSLRSVAQRQSAFPAWLLRLSGWTRLAMHQAQARHRRPHPHHSQPLSKKGNASTPSLRGKQASIRGQSTTKARPKFVESSTRNARPFKAFNSLNHRLSSTEVCPSEARAAMASPMGERSEQRSPRFLNANQHHQARSEHKKQNSLLTAKQTGQSLLRSKMSAEWNTTPCWFTHSCLNYYVMHYFSLCKTNRYCGDVHGHVQHVQRHVTEALYLELPLNQSSHYFLSNIQSRISSHTGTFTSILPIKLTSVYQTAFLVAQDISFQLEKKKSFRQICRAIFKQMYLFPAIKGIRIACSGRLNGAEIAKTECRKYGETSNHVFSEKIDYAHTKASTPSGILGVKVWIAYV